ncbi:MAG: efflux RND transporter permease subunit [Marinilabiliales bacterium]|nr:efflux RND transporter permease subunit [Marinilabiliales bacterium]
MTATDVSNALAVNNFISALGRTQGQMVTVDLTAATGLHTVDEFRNLVIKSVNGAIVRLGDVANVTLGAENYDVVRALRRQSRRVHEHQGRAQRQSAFCCEECSQSFSGYRAAVASGS